VATQKREIRSRPYWLRRRTDTSRPGHDSTGRLGAHGIRLNVFTAFVGALAVAAAGFLFAAGLDFGRHVWEAIRGGDPVRVFAVVERDQQVQGETWVFADPLAPSPQEEQLLGAASDRIDEFRTWARRNGGTDAELTILKLVVEGRSADTVRVIGMRALIDGPRGEPLRGTLLHAGPEQGSDITQVGLDLDENDPVARTVSKEGDPRADNYFGAPYFGAQQTKTLSRGEQEVFQITARTLRSSIQWHIAVTLLVDGREETVEVRPGGRNLMTTALRTHGSMQQAAGAVNYPEYRSLYVWDFMRSPNGFVRRDPGTFSRD
jgi:hypothetical protein